MTCPTTQVAGLFYAWDPQLPEAFTAAGDPGAVIRSTPLPWRLDHDWLRDWMLGCPDVAGSPFVGLQRLLPGQALELDPGSSPRVTNSIGADAWSRPDLAGEAAEQAFLEVFERAVADLADRVPVLTSELSGGLDSTFMVATLAQVAPTPLHAYVAAPDPAATLPATARIESDEAAARQLAAFSPTAITLHTVRTSNSESPLETARRISSRAWWPALGVSNLAWIEEIRNRAAALSSPYIWTGSNGNAAFSYSHPYAERSLRARLGRRRTRARSPSLLATLLTEAPRPPDPPDRHRYLTWLAGHAHPHAAFGNPAAFAIPSVDPYRAPEVLDVAARIKPEAWRRPGMTRGFARTLAKGRVPDGIRLRQARGAQGLDVWQQMYQHRVEYETQVELLAETPAIADLVDLDALRSLVGTWSWDRRLPPPQIETSVVNRLLAFGQFIRDADARLRRLTA